MIRSSKRFRARRACCSWRWGRRSSEAPAASSSASPSRRLAAVIFCWVLVVVTRTDFETRLIPDKIILPGAVARPRAAHDRRPESSSGSCARSAPALVLFLIVLIYPRGLGMGDVKLSAFLGAGLGISVDRRDVRRVLRRLRPRSGAVRAPRKGRAEAGDPARPVPRARRCDRTVLGRRDPRLVPDLGRQ